MRQIIVLALIVLAGCSTEPQREPAASVNLSGYPPAFRDGYNDGCQSARGRMKRDEARYKSDGQYALGWRDGRDLCKGR
jgi:hypothetical protein